MVKKEIKTKKRIFDLPINSRFLPGEVNSKYEKVDLTGYKKHRLVCANAKSVIDNKPPKFNLSTYYNRTILSEDEYLAKINFKHALELMKAVNFVSRHGGRVDCWNRKYKKPKFKEQNFLIEKEFTNNLINKENKYIYKKLTGMTEYGEYSSQVMAKSWKRLKADIISKSRFPWFKEISKYPSITHNATSSNVNVHRSKCFFDLELAQSKLPLGRIIFELYNDYVPMICANFEAFCRGYNGLSYKGTPFHHIMSDYWCQGGDVTKHNGIGGTSIVDMPSTDENFSLEHSCPGVLSTCSSDKNILDSKFNLTFRPLQSMNGRKVVFGKVIKGMQNLFKINAYGTKYGNVLQKIIVSNCGVLDRQKNKSKNLDNKK